MTQEWFWQTQGETYGPLSTDELESLVRRGKIDDGDLIRLGGTDEWQPAARIKALFADESPDESATVGAAARALEQAAQANERRKAELEAQAGKFSWSSLVPSGGFGITSLLTWGMALVELLIERVWRLVGRKSSLAVLLVVLAALLASRVEWRDTQTAAMRERLARGWAQSRELKRREASADEWRALEQETLEWLEPAVRSLSDVALRNQSGVNGWFEGRVRRGLAQQQLVSAANILREVLAAGKRGEPESAPAGERSRSARQPNRPLLVLAQVDSSPETLFAQRLNVADAFLSGAVPTVPGGTPPPVEKSSTDPLLIGMVIADVVGALAFGWWWMRKRPAARSSS
ncbi:MAG: DUF4339 domain-containing protein [Planctomycetales bacterium]